MLATDDLGDSVILEAHFADAEEVHDWRACAVCGHPVYTGLLFFSTLQAASCSGHGSVGEADAFARPPSDNQERRSAKP